MSIIINGTTGISGVDGTAGSPALQGNDTNTGVVFGTDTVGVVTGGVQRTTVDSSGRILVGTSSAGDYGLTYLGNTSRADTTFSFVSSTTGAANIHFGDSLSGNSQYAGYISYQHAIDALVFGTATTERMRITNSGQALFGTTSNFSAETIAHFRKDSFGICFAVSNEAGSGAQTFRSKMAAGSNSLASYHFVGTSGGLGDVGTDVVYIRGNGNLQNINNSYGGTSDAKLKENIVNASSQWDDIKALQVRKYNFKEGQAHTQIGLVAQEVEHVSPGLVSESPDRDAEGNDLGTVTKSVNYSVLYMKAVKALQEAMERIEQLETRISNLEVTP